MLRSFLNPELALAYWASLNAAGYRVVIAQIGSRFVVDGAPMAKASAR